MELKDPTQMRNFYLYKMIDLNSFNSYFLWIYCFASKTMISLLIFNSKIWAQITNEFLEFSLIGNVKCPNVSKLSPVG